MQKNTVTEKDLLAGIKACSPKSLGILYDLYAASLYHVILSRVVHRRTADKILQQTFLLLCSDVNSGDLKPGRLGLRLMGIARSLVKKELLLSGGDANPYSGSGAAKTGNTAFE